MMWVVLRQTLEKMLANFKKKGVLAKIEIVWEQILAQKRALEAMHAKVELVENQVLSISSTQYFAL